MTPWPELEEAALRVVREETHVDCTRNTHFHDRHPVYCAIAEHDQLFIAFSATVESWVGLHTKRCNTGKNIKYRL